MKEITLSKEGSLKIIRDSSSLYFSDLETNIKSSTPGEWVVLLNKKLNLRYYAFVNPIVENNAACVNKVNIEYTTNLDPWNIIKTLIDIAFKKREVFKDYKKNYRLFYGSSDGLPGLIIDSYNNCVIIQINTAGVDLYRVQIKEFLEIITKKKVILLDNEKYRLAERLPIYTNEDSEVNEVEVLENTIRYVIPKEQLQKVGFYFDHRENRLKLESSLKRLSRPLKNGLDLFSYVGAWGMTMLKAGMESVDFVDQGDFEKIIAKNLHDNNFPLSTFYRENVFLFLENSQREGRKYDLICSDPPAFCKTLKEKNKALEGYVKLHTGCLKLLNDKSFFIAASCTHYVSLEELTDTVNKAAFKSKKKMTLIDIGMQGIDHPTSSLSSKSNYLKYSLYYVENL